MSNRLKYSKLKLKIFSNAKKLIRQNFQFKQSAENIKSKSIEPKSECESSSASSVFAVQQNLQTKPLKVPQKKQNSERKVSSSKTMKKANQVSFSDSKIILI